MHDGTMLDPDRVHRHMSNPLPFPSVGHLEHAIAGLNDSRVGEFPWFILEQQSGRPSDAVTGDGEVDSISAAGQVIVDESESTVAESDGIDTGVVIGEFGARERGPGFTGIGRPGLENDVLTGAAEDLDLGVGVGEQCWLDGAPFFRPIERRCTGPGAERVPGGFHLNLPAGVFGA